MKEIKVTMLQLEQAAVLYTQVRVLWTQMNHFIRFFGLGI
jgi:hypothetical protein